MNAAPSRGDRAPAQPLPPAAAPHRTPRVSPFALAAFAGPLSFGITGPTLVLDDIARDLDVPVASATSVVTVFGWGVAVGTPLMGVLLARRGLRTALAVCALLIAAGAALVLTVPVLAVVVAGAGLQALGAAGVLVIGMSLAGSARSMGVVTATLAGLGALAPLIGTEVSDALSWPAVLAMTSLSLLALPAVLRGAGRGPGPDGPDGPDAAGTRDDRPFDAAGAVLLVAVVTALVFVPQRPLTAGACAVLAAVLLAARLRRRPDGFVPAVLLTAPRFVLSAGAAFLLAVANFGIIYASPELLGDLTGWSKGEMGIALAVPYLAGGAFSWFLVAASARPGYRALTGALLGGGAGAVAVVTAVALGAAWVPLMFLGMTAGSLAASTGQGALALRAADAVPEPRRATAMGLFNLCYLLGAAFGPALAALAVTG